MLSLNRPRRSPWVSPVAALAATLSVIACAARAPATAQARSPHASPDGSDPETRAPASTEAATRSPAAPTPPLATAAATPQSADTTTAPPRAEGDAATVSVGHDEPAPTPSAASPSRAAALPAGTTVLHIGDSFAGALGIDLNRELKEAGVRGILKYQTATYIPTWASSKDLDGYLGRYHPDLVLITLGANELEIPDPAQRAPTIRRLVARLGSTPCVWVAPPLWPGARPALLDTIRASCAPCAYLDSSALVPDLPRARDHIHPSMEARRTWAKAVAGWLAAHRVPSADKAWALAP
jgi:lysophospholipase L1-like esterase